MNYPYSPELKTPQRMPDIDPGKPAMAGMLKILCRTHQKQAEAFQPPYGLHCKKISVPSTDGTEIPCYVIETEEADGDLPGLLMIHGGAFYLPVQTSALALACEYARRLNARVFLPDYRLVPQFAAPSQTEDCLAVWTELSEHAGEHSVDPEKLLILGDSAGAALAAGLCIRLRDEGKTLPKGQLLIYPVTDDRTERYDSYERYASACWSPAATRSMWSAYLKGADERFLPWLVPARCGDLRGLPAAYVEPQEIDVLCDEGISYAERLKAAGVPTELNVVKGSYHGFDSDLSSSLVKRVLDQRIKAALSFLETV